MCTPFHLFDDPDEGVPSWLGPGHAPLLDAPGNSSGPPLPIGRRPLLTEYVCVSGPDRGQLETSLTGLIGRHDLTVTTTDPAAVTAAHADRCVVEPTGSAGPVRSVSGQVHGCGLNGLWLAWACYDTAVTITIRPPLGHLIVCLPSSAITGWTRTGSPPMHPGASGARPAAATEAGSLPGSAAEATVMFPASSFQRRTLTLSAHDGMLFIAVPATSPHARWRQLADGALYPLHLRLPSPLSAPRLARAAARVCDEADWLAAARTSSDPASPIPPLDAASLRDHLVDAFLFDVHDAIDLASAAPAHTPTINPQLAHRAARWLHANHHRRLSMKDLAAALMTTDRHLHSVITATLGLSTMRVLRTIRLDAARQLLISDPHATVREIGHKVGIAHYGRFTRYYRDRFGESPSATRARSNPDAR